MPKVKLTDRSIAAIDHEDREAIHWDTEVTGLGLRVQPAPSDKMTFVLRYRNRRKQQRFMTLGKKGDINAGKARKMALSHLSKVAEGKDPAKELKDAAAAPTLEQLMNRYLDDHAIPNKKKSSVDADKINIARQIFPNIKPSTKVDEITQQDVDKMKANLKDKPGAFNRSRAVLSKAMELAELWGYRQQNSNPCHFVKQYPPKKLERFLSDEEFAALGEALAEGERTATESPYAIAAFRLLIFLGARRGEILNLEWKDVDLERGFIMLPDSKTGRKPLFLNAPTIEILGNLKRVKGNPYVIVGQKKGQPIADLKRSWQRIRKAAGITDCRIHDLRHSFASVGVVSKVPLQIVSTLLGHSKVSTTERYSHIDNDPVRAAGDAIANQIAAAMKQNTKTGEIVPFAKKGA